MLTIRQRLVLMLLRIEGPLKLAILIAKFPITITQHGLKTVITRLKRGDLVTEQDEFILLLKKVPMQQAHKVPNIRLFRI